MHARLVIVLNFKPNAFFPIGPGMPQGRGYPAFGAFYIGVLCGDRVALNQQGSQEIGLIGDLFQRKAFQKFQGLLI